MSFRRPATIERRFAVPLRWHADRPGLRFPSRQSRGDSKIHQTSALNLPARRSAADLPHAELMHGALLLFGCVRTPTTCITAMKTPWCHPRSSGWTQGVGSDRRWLEASRTLPGDMTRLAGFFKARRKTPPLQSTIVARCRISQINTQPPGLSLWSP